MFTANTKDTILRFNRIIVITSVFLGITMLSIGSPVLGEMFATMAPIYNRKDDQLLENLGFDHEDVNFQTTDALVLRGWFFPSDEPDAPAILYAPSTSHDQRSGLSLVAPLHQAGFNVLLFSYRGHGISDGDRFGFTYGAVEKNDIDAAVNYLYETKGIRRIGAIGHSAGAVSLILSGSTNSHLGAIVAASPFASLEEIWETNRPAFFPKPLYRFTFWFSEKRKGFSRDQVNSLDVIGQIAPRPLMIIHGSDDRRITTEQALRLYARAKYPKQFVMLENLTHNGVRNPGLDAFVGRIINFFNYSLRSPVAEIEGNVKKD